MQNVMEGLSGSSRARLSDIIPVLATEWTVSADGLTYTFKLRQGVKFHDGTDFNADAVKYNYMRWKNAPDGAPATPTTTTSARSSAGTANVERRSRSTRSTTHTVVDHPQEAAARTSSSPRAAAAFAIQSPTALKAGDADNPDPAQDHVRPGQGDRHGRHRSVQVQGVGRRRPRHDRQEPRLLEQATAAHLDEVIFKPFAEQAAELNGLQSDGEIDIAQTIAPIDIADAEGRPEPTRSSTAASRATRRGSR